MTPPTPHFAHGSLALLSLDHRHGSRGLDHIFCLLRLGMALHESCLDASTYIQPHFRRVRQYRLARLLHHVRLQSQSFPTLILISRLKRTMQSLYYPSWVYVVRNEWSLRNYTFFVNGGVSSLACR